MLNCVKILEEYQFEVLEIIIDSCAGNKIREETLAATTSAQETFNSALRFPTQQKIRKQPSIQEE